jgi:hypothetical protein
METVLICPECIIIHIWIRVHPVVRLLNFLPPIIQCLLLHSPRIFFASRWNMLDLGEEAEFRKQKTGVAESGSNPI